MEYLKFCFGFIKACFEVILRLILMCGLPLVIAGVPSIYLVNKAHPGSARELAKDMLNWLEGKRSTTSISKRISSDQEVFETEYASLQLMARDSTNQMQATHSLAKILQMVPKKAINKFELKVIGVKQEVGDDKLIAHCESVCRVDYNHEEHTYYINYYVSPADASTLNNLQAGSTIIVSGQGKEYFSLFEDWTNIVFIENATIQSSY